MISPLLHSAWDVIREASVLHVVIVEKFEADLRRLNPGYQNFNYRVEDIFAYIDSMSEFNILV